MMNNSWILLEDEGLVTSNMQSSFGVMVQGFLLLQGFADLQ